MTEETKKEILGMSVAMGQIHSAIRILEPLQPLSPNIPSAIKALAALALELNNRALKSFGPPPLIQVP